MLSSRKNKLSDEQINEQLNAALAIDIYSPASADQHCTKKLVDSNPLRDAIVEFLVNRALQQQTVEGGVGERVSA